MKWVPKYWSMVKNPSDRRKNTSWKIGTDKSISESNTYNLYVFFRKIFMKNILGKRLIMLNQLRISL